MLAHHAISLDYYWSYMQTNATHYMHTCDQCQGYIPQQHQTPT